MGVNLEIIAQAIWLILPAYAANGAAVLVGGGKPIDFGKVWRDGRRILGDGKTWRGLFYGSLVGSIVGFSQAVAGKYLELHGRNNLHLDYFEGFPLMIPLVLSLCFGALLGDIVESFFKRRVGKERGEDWIPFDQLDFLIGALILCYMVSAIFQFAGILDYNWFLKNFSPLHLLVIFVVTPFLHIISNKLYRGR